MKINFNELMNNIATNNYEVISASNPIADLSIFGCGTVEMPNCTIKIAGKLTINLDTNWSYSVIYAVIDGKIETLGLTTEQTKELCSALYEIIKEHA